MDESKTQFCKELIDLLMSSPIEQEKDILLFYKDHEYFDPAYLQLGLFELAEYFKYNIANDAVVARLIRLGESLPETLGLPVWPESNSQETIKPLHLFICEIFACIRANIESEESVQLFLRDNEERIVPELLNTLPEVISDYLNIPYDGDPKRATALKQGVCIVTSRFGHAFSKFPGGQPALNSELAIVAFEEVVKLISQTAKPIQWAGDIINLASAYSNRILGNRAENVERAIKLNIAALQELSSETAPIVWATAMNNLGNCYIESLYGDRFRNIEQAIDCYKQALIIRTQQARPREWATTLNNISRAFSVRVEGNRAENIDTAICYHWRVLQVQAFEEMPDKWAETKHLLALAYYQRIRGSRAENMEAMLTACEDALKVRKRETMPFEWAASMNSLALAHHYRIKGDKAENLEKAIEAYNEALHRVNHDELPDELWVTLMTNLALAYSDRIKGNRENNIQKAIDINETLLNLESSTIFPRERRRIAYAQGNLYAKQQNWVAAAEVYQHALEACEVLYRHSISLKNQAEELANNNKIFHLAAYAQARAGNLDAAIVTLEQSRARILSESLERDRISLEVLQREAPSIYAQYQQAKKNLRQLEVQERSEHLTINTESPSSCFKRREYAESVYIEFNAAIEAVRLYPGYDTFYGHAEISDIAAVLQADRPLVYILPTLFGTVALIAQSVKDTNIPLISPIWIDNFSTESVMKLIHNSAEDNRDDQDSWFKAYNRRKEYPMRWFKTIESVTHRLWSQLMGEIVNEIDKLAVQQIIIIPVGLLSILPLHAAWTEDKNTPTCRRYALDNFAFLYAPNARSINLSQQAIQQQTGISLLAINNPLPSQADVLPYSQEETQAVCSYFSDHQLLSGQNATREAILEAIHKYNVLHFSCHGVANSALPLESGLLMAQDEMLTLQDFLDLEFGDIRLAILSACETALPGTKLLDEILSLSTGLLQSGVAGVAASLWSVEDRSTMMLVVRFYYYWRTKKYTPPQALQKAQKWVRDTPYHQQLAYFSSLDVNVTSQRTLSSTPEDRENIGSTHLDPTDFSHPFYWAAFCYVGV